MKARMVKVRLTELDARVELKHLVEDRDRHGNIRLYVRIKGRPKVRLHKPPGTPEFIAEYRIAVRGEGPAPTRPKGPAAVEPGTLQWLCQRYYASVEFKQLGSSTRKARQLVLDSICRSKTPRGRDRASLPFAAMEPRHIAEIRDEKAALPAAANQRVKIMRQLFKWAAKPSIGLSRTNPAREVEFLDAASDGHLTWTVAQVRQFEAFHPVGTKARLALALMLMLGVRRSDAVCLGRQMETGQGTICFTEAKGERLAAKRRELPILPQLRAVIAASPTGDLNYLVTEYGKPFTVAGFGNWFRDRCVDAGVPGRAHGLRKAGATIAAENGATENQLMAIFGWESPAQAAVYTKKANRKRLAADAMHLLLPGQNENEVSHLLDGVAESGTKMAVK